MVVALVVTIDGDNDPVVTDVASPPRIAEPAAPSAVGEPGPYQWARVPHDDAAFGAAAGQRMTSVTAVGPGLVAVGVVGNGGGAHAAVWTSPDGVSWSRVPHDEAAFGGVDDKWMESVTAGGPGLVAVGVVGGGEGEGDAAVWTSVDGVAWSRVPHDEAVFGGAAMSDVIAGGPGLVAVGGSAESDAVVWTSVDGFTWSRVPHDEAVFGGGATSGWTA